MTASRAATCAVKSPPRAGASDRGFPSAVKARPSNSQVDAEDAVFASGLLELPRSANHELFDAALAVRGDIKGDGKSPRSSRARQLKSRFSLSPGTPCAARVRRLRVQPKRARDLRSVNRQTARRGRRRRFTIRASASLIVLRDRPVVREHVEPATQPSAPSARALSRGQPLPAARPPSPAEPAVPQRQPFSSTVLRAGRRYFPTAPAERPLRGAVKVQVFSLFPARSRCSNSACARLRSSDQ